MFSRIRHRIYLLAQIKQSWAKREKDPGFRTLRYLLEAREAFPGHWPWPAPVLCLGPRNGLELAYIRKAIEEPSACDQACCGGPHPTRTVEGLDLFSLDKDIRVGDMHKMPYQDNAFGLVWASHVLEHARDIGAVLGEIRRVLRPGGWLFAAYPTEFKTNWHDRYDLGDPRNLMALGLGQSRLIYGHAIRRGESAEWSGLLEVHK